MSYCIQCGVFLPSDEVACQTCEPTPASAITNKNPGQLERTLRASVWPVASVLVFVLLVLVASMIDGFPELARRLGRPSWAHVLLVPFIVVAVRGTVRILDNLLDRIFLRLSNLGGSSNLLEQKSAVLILVSISTVFVLLGLGQMHYGFYVVLRLVVCLTAAVEFSKAWKLQSETWLWVTGVLMVLYNPLLPIRFGEKSLWIVVNFVTIALFWVASRQLTQVEKPV